MFEHVQVLDDRRHRHRQWTGELADGRRSAGQTFDHRPPAGVRERLEQKVDLPVGGMIGMGLLKHSLKYYHTRAGDAGRELYGSRYRPRSSRICASRRASSASASSGS